MSRATDKDKSSKYDPNTEAFQMRTQWKKTDNCRKLWYERWSWLLDERKETLAESDAIRQEAADALNKVFTKDEIAKSLKPVPVTSSGVVGWLACRPDCQLEIYKSWLDRPPRRLPDTWDYHDYFGKQESN